MKMDYRLALNINIEFSALYMRWTTTSQKVHPAPQVDLLICTESCPWSSRLGGGRGKHNKKKIVKETTRESPQKVAAFAEAARR